MALIIQATTIAGKIIDGARWEVTSLSNFQQNQRVSIELPVKDPNLLGYLSKTQNKDCMLDGERGQYSVVMACVVSDVRHMIYISNKTVDTMVIVKPIHRTVEHVLEYLLSPGRCDQRFVRMIRGDASGSDVPE